MLSKLGVSKLAKRGVPLTKTAFLFSLQIYFLYAILTDF